MLGALVGIAGKLRSAGTFDQSTSIWPLQNRGFKLVPEINVFQRSRQKLFDIYN
jgi:hypothetical protein